MIPYKIRFGRCHISAILEVWAKKFSSNLPLGQHFFTSQWPHLMKTRIKRHSVQMLWSSSLPPGYLLKICFKSYLLSDKTIFTFGRSSYPWYCFEKVLLEISQNHRKTPVPEPFFKLCCKHQLATFLKKRLWHKRFPVNFARFLRTLFLTEHLRWLILFWLTP